MYLNLENNLIGTVGYMSLVELLIHSTSLKELDISDNDADHDGIVSIAAVLNFNNTTLKTLRID